MADSKAVDAELRDALDQLNQLVERRPYLDQHAATLRGLLPMMVHTSPPEIDGLTERAAVEKLQAGIPMLRGEAPLIDADEFRHRWQSVCRAVRRYHASRSAVKKVAKVVDSPSWSGAQLAADVLGGSIELVYARAKAIDLDAELTATVAAKKV